MPYSIERIALPASSPGTTRTLVVHRFGRPGTRPKAYLQAAIHPDEPPGMLILHHLARRLAAADAAGEVTGDPGSPDRESVAVVPAAEELSTPVAGLVLYPAPLGRKVERGELVAEIVDPTAAPETPRVPLHAGIAGHVISRRLQRIVGPGDFVAMIVGPD